jgi:hypothetical protein
MSKPEEILSSKGKTKEKRKIMDVCILIIA